MTVYTMNTDNFWPPEDNSSLKNVFFFQAEDGIRDRSPSRGLGDVYKRQAEELDMLKDHDRPF